MSELETYFANLAPGVRLTPDDQKLLDDFEQDAIQEDCTGTSSIVGEHGMKLWWGFFYSTNQERLVNLLLELGQPSLVRVLVGDFDNFRGFDYEDYAWLWRLIATHPRLREQAKLAQVDRVGTFFLRMAGRENYGWDMSKAGAAMETLDELSCWSLFREKEPELTSELQLFVETRRESAMAN